MFRHQNMLFNIYFVFFHFLFVIMEGPDGIFFQDLPVDKDAQSSYLNPRPPGFFSTIKSFTNKKLYFLSSSYFRCSTVLSYRPNLSSYIINTKKGKNIYFL